MSPIAMLILAAVAYQATIAVALLVAYVVDLVERSRLRREIARNRVQYAEDDRT